MVVLQGLLVVKELGIASTKDCPACSNVIGKPSSWTYGKFDLLSRRIPTNLRIRLIVFLQGLLTVKPCRVVRADDHPASQKVAVQLASWSCGKFSPLLSRIPKKLMI